MCKLITADHIIRLLNVIHGEESEIISDEVHEQNQNNEKVASFSVELNNHQINLH